MGVCTKERKGVTAAVLMATPCTNSLGGESGGQKHEVVYLPSLPQFPILKTKILILRVLPDGCERGEGGVGGRWRDCLRGQPAQATRRKATGMLT